MLRQGQLTLRASACAGMWSEHDVYNHDGRGYRRHDLDSLLGSAGFVARSGSDVNTLALRRPELSGWSCGSFGVGGGGGAWIVEEWPIIRGVCAYAMPPSGIGYSDPLPSGYSPGFYGLKHLTEPGAKLLTKMVSHKNHMDG